MSAHTKREQFPATRSRPTAYPATIPFVADRDVEVIQGRSGSVLAARWLVTDPDALFSLLVSSSILDGWRVRAPGALTAPLFSADCTLERNDVVRGITITRIDTLAIVALTDASIRGDAQQSSER